MDITTHNKPIFRKLIALLIIFVLLINNSKAQNLLVNGDFESGISGTGFQTQSPYNYLSTLSGNSNPGDYAIITNPNAMNTTWFLNCKDHTSGTGKMMVIDGITTGGQQRLWKAGNSGGGVGPLTVGTTYTFSYWIRSVSKSATDINTTANIGIQFNNASNITLTAGSTLLPFDTATGWVQVKYTFVPTNAYVNIEMYNNNTSAVGNDFALDDIAVLAPPLPLSVSYSLQNPTCYNNTDGYIIAYGSGGTAPYTYSFNGGVFSTTNTLTGLATSSHTVTVKDAILNTVSNSIINITAPSNPLTASASVNPICSGNNTTLTATNGGASYNWTASPVDPSLTTPGIYNPVVSPAVATTYTVTSSTTTNVNLIYNGNFSLGNTGFTTDYTYKTINTGGAQRSYGVMPNAQVFFNTFSTCGDQSTGTENMYVVDGSLNSADKVWCQTVVVKPSTTYTFSYWIQTLTINNPAQIETKINGVTVPAGTSANPVNAPATVTCGNWQQVSYNWSSGAGVTTAQICLYDKNVNANGNDFALDDISFTGSYGCNLSKTITIAVNPPASTNNINLFDCNSVTYHGNTYTNNTIVRDTLKAVQGCDSVYNVVNITVNSTIATNKTNNLASCKSIIYKGNTYTSSTILKDTLKSVMGCDSVYNTVNININPITPVTKNTSISGCDSLVYKSITYKASTILKDTVKSYQGCDSVYNIATITVYPAIAKPTASVTQQPNCNTLKGTIVVNAPTGANIYYSIGASYQTSNTFGNLAPNSYDVVASDLTTGCVSPIHTLVVNPIPNQPNTPTASVTVQPTCSAATGLIVITAPLGNNFYYSVDGINFQSATTFSGLSSKNYQVTAKDTGTKCVSAILSLTVNPVPNAPATPNASVTVQPNCTVSTGTIKVISPIGVNLYYSIGGVYQSSTTFSGLAPNNYSVIVKDSNTGCISPAKNLVVNAVPTAPSAPAASVTTQPTCTIPTGTIDITAPTGANLLYSVNGTNYQPGSSFTGLNPATYSLTVKDNTTGCISSALNLTINSVAAAPATPTASVTQQPTCTTPTGAIDITAPVGANYMYSIDGVNYQNTTNFAGLAPATYSVTVKDSNTNCISPLLNLVVDTVQNIPTPTGYVSVQPTCSNALGTFIISSPHGSNYSYYINGSILAFVDTIYPGSSSGTYSIVAFDVNTGCFSDTLNLTLNPFIPITPTNNVINLVGCNSVIFKGITYTSNTIIKDTVKSYQGCDSVYNNVNITITPLATITNTQTISSCKSIVYNSNTYSASTVLRDTVKSTNGCDSVYNIVNININPITATANNQTISTCNNIVYNGNTYATSTVLRDTVKSLQGCDSVYNIVNININPIATSTNAQTLSSCKSVVYNGNTYSSSTVLKDTMKSLQGCDSIYNTVNININPIATSTNTQTLSSCKSVVYNGNTYSVSTVLRDTVKSTKGCDSVYNIVSININPIITKTNNQTISSCKTIVYNGNTYSVSTVLRDTVKSTKGCDSVYNIVSISINPIIAIIKTTNYTGCGSVNYKNVLYTTSISYFDTIKNLQGCDSIYNINNIIVYPLPKIIVGGNLLVMPNSSVVLNPSISNAISISFTPSKYLDDSTSSNPICTPLSDQTYLIKATSIDGCTDTSSFKIFIVKPISVPNVFSPNGDGINDTWDIAHITDYPFATISIFNRQGQLLKSSKTTSIRVWDGTYNGQPVPVAVYYWIIKLTPNSESMSGIVTVLR